MDTNTMTNYCQNCNAELNGNFCSHCGQSSNTHKINLHYLLHEIQHGLLHVDKGIVFTIKELFTRPGYSIADFLNGKRVKHFKPISLVLFLATIYGILTHYFNINLLSNNIQVSGSGEKFNQAQSTIEKMNEWISQHYSIIALLQIPIFSIGTYICFKKTGYNFIEHLVIQAFITGQKLVVHIFVFPLYYWFNNSSLLKITARTTDLVCYLIAIWTLYQLFRDLSFIQKLWRIILSLFIPLAFLFLILLTVISKLILA